MSLLSRPVANERRFRGTLFRVASGRGPRVKPKACGQLAELSIRPQRLEAGDAAATMRRASRCRSTTNQYSPCTARVGSAAEALSRTLPATQTRPQSAHSGSMTYPPREGRVSAR
jgi:hypothetical protein